MDFVEMPLGIFSLEFTMKSKTSINKLLAQPAAQVWLKTMSFVAVKILTCQTHQLFSPYISWDKYHHSYTCTFYGCLIL